LAVLFCLAVTEMSSHQRTAKSGCPTKAAIQIWKVSKGMNR
jgi:hypothetical protein